MGEPRFDARSECLGWRVWYLNDAGRLQSIFLRDAAYWSVPSGRVELVLPVIEGKDSRGRYVEAQCAHGNQVPSAACLCGVHFVPTVGQCLKWAAIVESRKQTDGPWAFTFGVAAGRVAAGITLWGSRCRNLMRCWWMRFGAITGFW